MNGCVNNVIVSGAVVDLLHAGDDDRVIVPHATRSAARSADRRECARPRRPQIGPYRYVRRRWWYLCAVIDAIGWSCVLAIARLRRLLGRADVTVADQACTNPRSILLVQLDHLGDAVLSLPLVAALRRAHPDARIEVLCGAWNHSLWAACPHVDTVHVSTVNRFARNRTAARFWIFSLLTWIRSLRSRRYDWAIDVRGELPLAFLLWAIGARRRIGWDAGGGGFLLTSSPNYVPNRHEIASRRALAAEMGIIGDTQKAAWQPHFCAPPRVRRRIADDLAAELEIGRAFAVLHIGAGTAAKQWPTYQWIRLARAIRSGFDLPVVVVGAGDDAAIATQIVEATDDGIVDWRNRYEVPALAALIEKAEVFVGADSGPAHLAAAVGTPVVVLFSGTNRPEMWRPVGPQVHVVRQPVPCSPCHETCCPLADHPCMTSISVEQVLAAIVVALGVHAQE